MSGILFRVGLGLSIVASVVGYAACRMAARADEAIEQSMVMLERARRMHAPALVGRRRRPAVSTEHRVAGKVTHSAL